jgi:ribosome-binding factor A
VYYTVIGDEKTRKDTAKALGRATPFLRRQIGDRIRLRRVPELFWEYDESVEKQDRIEKILLDLQRERDEREQAQAAQDAQSSTPPEADE